jgi:CsoR family transcriptional regulator, copper-sensing transcriptional repressor
MSIPLTIRYAASVRTSGTPRAPIPPRQFRVCGTFVWQSKNHGDFGRFIEGTLSHWSRAGVYRGMLDDTQQQSLVTRLNRVEGQIRGIRRMVQEPRLCVELLQQLSAAEAALNRISLAVFKFHVERCVPDGIVLGDPEKTRRLAELVDIFDRFAK